MLIPDNYWGSPVLMSVENSKPFDTSPIFFPFTFLNCKLE